MPRYAFRTALTALLLVACEPVNDPVGDLDGLDGSSSHDASLHVDAKVDAVKTDAKTDAADAGPPAKEACGNAIDDDGDGLIDENCYPAPNLRADEQWLDLGVVAVGTQGAPSKTFGVPNKNAGVLMVATDVSTTPYDHYVWANVLTSPTGVQVLTAADWAQSYNRAYPGIGGATVLLGMSTSVTVSAGPWTFGFVRSDQLPSQYVGKTSPTFLHLGVLARPEVPSPQMMSLDLDVYLADGVPMPAAQFEASPQWQSMRAKVEQVWKPANVQLGTVHVYDLGGDDGKKYHFLDNVLAGDGSNELAQVYQATGKLHPLSSAATLVITAGLTDNNAPVAAGLSQLAGVPGLAGSRMGGMAIVIDPTQWQQVVALGPKATTAGDVWGLILAHEIGHFLGLWHTDEADGKLHDPIDDTPECTKAGNKLTPEACPTQAKFLMFWSPKGSTVTSQQASVVRHSPGLR
jgi:hypothetical protein